VASAPATFAVIARAGRPQCTTVQIGQDWFDEDHIVVDCEGHIVVQSRQLAMVPAAH
jgi:Acyl-CoA thioesterase C-terminal domain